MSIAHLYELSFTDEELKKLAREELAVLILLGHISNEIGALQRLIHQCVKPSPKAVEIHDAYRVYLFFLLRSLMAVLVEATKAVRNSHNKLRRTKGIPLSHSLDVCMSDLKSFERTRHFQIAYMVRKKTRYHYDLNDVLQLVEGRDSYAPFKSFGHADAANSFHPFAEDLFPGLFVMTEIEKGGQAVTSEKLWEWMQWGLEFAPFFQRVFFEYRRNLLEHYFPEKQYTKVTPYYDAGYCAQPGGGFAPLFVDRNLGD